MKYIFTNITYLILLICSSCKVSIVNVSNYSEDINWHTCSSDITKPNATEEPIEYFGETLLTQYSTSDTIDRSTNSAVRQSLLNKSVDHLKETKKTYKFLGKPYKKTHKPNHISHKSKWRDILETIGEGLVMVLAYAVIVGIIILAGLGIKAIFPGLPLLVASLIAIPILIIILFCLYMLASRNSVC